MRTRTIAVAAALFLAPLTACSSEPDAAACKAAMAKQLDEAIDSGKEGTQPDVCKDVDTATLERIAGELAEDQLGEVAKKVLESAMPSPSPTPTGPNIRPECRAWIESELLDDSSSIDAAGGEDACGYLPKDELDQAIDDVTDELIREGAAPTP